MTRYPEEILGVLAGVVIASAQLIYLTHTLHRKIKPSVLSWLGWALLMGTSLVAQILTKGWQWSMTSILCSTFGCLAIAAVAFFSGHFFAVAQRLVFSGAGVFLSLYLCVYRATRGQPRYLQSARMHACLGDTYYRQSLARPGFGKVTGMGVGRDLIDAGAGHLYRARWYLCTFSRLFIAFQRIDGMADARAAEEGNGVDVLAWKWY